MVFQFSFVIHLNGACVRVCAYAENEKSNPKQKQQQQQQKTHATLYLSTNYYCKYFMMVSDIFQLLRFAFHINHK